MGSNDMSGSRMMNETKKTTSSLRPWRSAISAISPIHSCRQILGAREKISIDQTIESENR
jgi:hypothetical protein